ncbi:MAG: hypothetical protein QOK40_2449 [Miltoncostaeaceae bacterium]|jgi:uncharacterized integral membrane protein|nr:hypothetical protein [Miltoncostaeaceae bacterium]
MAEHGGGDQLPRAWPFEIAGLLFMVAMLYFCSHFALKDQGTETPLFSVFWPLILGSIAMIVFGALINYRVEHGRRR